MFFSGLFIFAAAYSGWSFDFLSKGLKEIHLESQEQAFIFCSQAQNKYNKEDGSFSTKIIKTRGASNSIWGIHKKGYIVLEKANYEDLEKNDYVIYKIKKKLINHRLRSKTKKGWIIEGDGNRSHDRHFVTKSNFIGRVLDKTFYRY